MKTTEIRQCKEDKEEYLKEHYPEYCSLMLWVEESREIREE